MLNSITILGSSSGRNAGDAALVSGMMDPIDEACAARLLYEVPTIRPAYLKSAYPNNTRAVGMMPWDLSIKLLGLPTYRSIMRTDLSLIFDAILFDRSLYNPLFNHLSTLYLMLPIAKRRGKKIAMYNVGVGPIDTPAGAKMLRVISDLCDFITVRDQGSLDILKRVGVTNPRVVMTADAALLVKPASDQRVTAIMKSVGLDPSQEILGLNVSAYLNSWAEGSSKPISKEQFVAVYSAAINRVLKEINVPVLFVGTQHHDIPLSDAIIPHIKSTKPVASIANRDYDHFEIMGVLGKLALLFGMRLHSLILASAGRTPISGLPHQPKVTYYLNTLGLTDFNLSFDDFSEESLARHILKSWHARKEIRSTLERRIPLLQNEARKATRLVQALHNDEDLDQVITGFSAHQNARALAS